MMNSTTVPALPALRCRPCVATLACCAHAAAVVLEGFSNQSSSYCLFSSPAKSLLEQTSPYCDEELLAIRGPFSFLHDREA